MRRRLVVASCLAAVALALVARLPLHRATFGLPLSNDDALVLLMARHVAIGEPVVGFWNQPYGGALDAWVLAPLARVVDPHALFRAYQLACALALAGAMAAVAGRAAGVPAALATLLVMAAGPPYVALMGALGIVPYLLAPLLLAGLAWAAIGACRDDGPAAWAWAGLGVAAGLGVWNSLLAAPAAAGIVAGLVACRRGRGLARIGVPLVAGAAVGLLPLLVASVRAGGAPSSVAGVRPGWLWPAAAADLGRALAGLFGLHAPLVIDGPTRIELAVPLQVMVGLVLAALAAAGAVRKESWPLAGWALASAAAFVIGARGRGDRVRYLFLMAPPVLALAGIGLAWLARRRRVAAVAALAALLVPWTIGAHRLAAAWRDPGGAPRLWGAVDLGPAAHALSSLEVLGAYATTQLAGRLTLATGERTLVSPAVNERFPGHPLRFRDEVDLEPRVAWVLNDEISRGMPRAPAFRRLLDEIGGTARATRAGAMTVFHAFVPPYDEARAVPRAAIGGAPAPWLDRDASTSAGCGPRIELTLDAARRVDGLVLVVGAGSRWPPPAWTASVDGTVVARGPTRLQWAAGAPREGRQTQLSVALRGAQGRRVTLRFEEDPRLDVREVFLYGGGEPERPTDGAHHAEQARDAARRGDWGTAAAAQAEAVRREPERASHHAALVRARWRAERPGAPASLPD